MRDKLESCGKLTEESKVDLFSNEERLLCQDPDTVLSFGNESGHANTTSSTLEDRQEGTVKGAESSLGQESSESSSFARENYRMVLANPMEPLNAPSSAMPFFSVGGNFSAFQQSFPAVLPQAVQGKATKRWNLT